MNLIFVPEDHLVHWYGKARRFIREIAENSGGRLSENCIRECLLHGRFWLAIAADGDEAKAAMILQKINWATGLNELVLMIAGEGLPEWKHFYGEIESKAKELGFHMLCDAGGRRGMGKLLAEYGWVETGSVYQKDLR